MPQFLQSREAKIILNVIWVVAQLMAAAQFHADAQSQTAAAAILAAVNVILHAHPDKPVVGTGGTGGTKPQ